MLLTTFEGQFQVDEYLFCGCISKHNPVSELSVPKFWKTYGFVLPSVKADTTAPKFFTVSIN